MLLFIEFNVLVSSLLAKENIGVSKTVHAIKTTSSRLFIKTSLISM